MCTESDRSPLARGPNEERSAATRQTLITVARNAFRDDGYAKTSLAAIATEVSMTKGAVYHHFADKQAVLDAVVREIQGELRDVVAKAARRQRTPHQRLVAGSLAYLDACAQLGPLSHVLFVDAPAGLGWRRWREIDAEHFRGDLEASVKAVLDDGSGVSDAVSMASAVSAVLMDAALEITSSDRPAHARRDAEATLRTLLESIAPQS